MKIFVFWFTPFVLAGTIVTCLAQSRLQVPAEVEAEVHQRWPDFQVQDAQFIVLFDEEDEYRREFVAKTATGRPSASAEVIDAHENHEYAAQWGSSVSISVLLCPRTETVNIIEKGISDLLKGKQYETVMPWNSEGFLLAERPPGSTPVIFDGLKDNVKLIIKVDHHLQEHLGVVSLLYEIFASPRAKDKQAFEDRSQDGTARRYIGVLLESMKETVAGCVHVSCRRVSSGRQLSRQEAITKLDSELTDRQAAHVKAAIKEEER
jgi:hypothetical protein